ncbi:MAG TPA: tetratricopeptide repeat protein [Longimicrobium sp.]|nr:tetratricopeptide repeat protein [Longimicrobium sp.]
MKPPRKPTRPPLPRAPLEFAHPLSVERGEVSGAILLAEAPREYALPLWRTYRLVLSTARRGRAALALDAPGLARWEAYVLEQVDAWDADVWGALAVIATAMRNPAEADREWIAFACMALADWCVERGAGAAAVCLAEAAAIAVPGSARYAYVAGRMHRERGNYRDAEHWLDRSRRVAVWNSDREAHAIALNSLGNLNQQVGRYAVAEAFLRSALLTARRARLRERIPFIYHDLLVVAVYTGNLARAGEYAREALHAYPPGHPNVPKLAHDIAWLWFQHGYFRRALQVFDALLLSFTEPGARLHVLGYAARAAGATADEARFGQYWSEAWEIIRQDRSERLHSAAALELGLGALELSRWNDAEAALAMAVESAAASGENETVVTASAALERVGRREGASRAGSPAGGKALHAEDAFAGELAAELVAHGGVSGVPLSTAAHDASRA